ncbi:MAG: hypothetical protein M3O68_08225 [Thermoproteota archaeon]|jgi:hypothetical protein|nr:hypothetical protein [Thermoproteota archaeon]
MTNKTFALVLALAICTMTSGLIAMQFTSVFAQGNATQAGNQTGNQTGNQSSGGSSSTPSTSGQQAGTPDY